MSKHPPAPPKPRRKRSPRPPGSPSAHSTTGYSMPNYIHEAIAAAAAGHTKGSALSKMIVDAIPAAGIGHPPIKLRPLPKLHGKKRASKPKSKRWTLTLPLDYSDRLEAYSELHGHSPAGIVSWLIDGRLPKLKTLKAALRKQRLADAVAEAAATGKKP